MSMAATLGRLYLWSLMAMTPTVALVSLWAGCRWEQVVLNCLIASAGAEMTALGLCLGYVELWGGSKE